MRMDHARRRAAFAMIRDRWHIDHPTVDRGRFRMPLVRLAFRMCFSAIRDCVRAGRPDNWRLLFLFSGDWRVDVIRHVRWGASPVRPRERGR